MARLRAAPSSMRAARGGGERLREQVLLVRVLLVQEEGSAAELALREQAVHREHARARDERGEAEDAQEEDAPVEDPREAPDDALLAGDAAAGAAGVEHVAQRVEPQRVRLREGDVVAEVRGLAHVAVELGRLALLREPVVVLLGLVAHGERDVELVQVRDAQPGGEAREASMTAR